MKIKELLALVDKGWVRKPRGFRVHYEKVTPEGLIADFLPGPDQEMMESDVVAWRSAWKLAQATATPGTANNGEPLVNIYVVDDEGQPVKYYATDRFDVFNPCAPKGNRHQGDLP